LHKKEAIRLAQDATLLFSLLLLTSFELFCIGGTHTLFGIFCISMLKSFIIYLCMSHNGYFFFCVSFSPRLLWSFAQLTHTHKPSHSCDTCAMLRNTQKATLNRIGTQRKKMGYKGGASYTYAKVRCCQNTRLAVMSMKVESKD
jgi:hypothetical protein